MTLDWKGDQLISTLRRAQVEGIEATMAAAVIHAKNNHEWINRSDRLETSIDIHEHAVATPTGARGVWGSIEIVYALIHELGGQFIKARPYLRPAAAAQYPGLARRIKVAMDAGGKGMKLPSRSAKVGGIIAGAVARHGAGA